MKVLIDCSSLRVGGGIQVAQSFLYDLVEMGKGEDIFFILLSPQLRDNLDLNIFPKRFIFHMLEANHYTNIFRRRLKVKKIEADIAPDVIFCVFGPSYYRSKCKKVVGYAIPHYIYGTSPFFKRISKLERLKILIMKIIHIYCFKNFSDIIVFETEDARTKFCDKYQFDIKNTRVVSNTLNQIFDKQEVADPILDKDENLITILCMASNYPHKNLDLIPKVIDILQETYLKKRFKFVITVSKHELKWNSRYDESVSYLGKVKIESIPALYRTADVLFMPTLLEVFSTTYLEAMKMEVPIATSNLSFAKDICGSSALYFDPESASDAASRILDIVTDLNLKQKLVEFGKVNLGRFGKSIERTRYYLDILHEKT